MRVFFGGYGASAQPGIRRLPTGCVGGNNYWSLETSDDGDQWAGYATSEENIADPAVFVLAGSARFVRLKVDVCNPLGGGASSLNVFQDSSRAQDSVPGSNYASVAVRVPSADDVTDPTWLDQQTRPIVEPQTVEVELPTEGMTPAGTLPISVGPVTHGEIQDGHQVLVSESPDRVRITALGAGLVADLGAQFLAFQIVRADGGEVAAPVAVRVDYGAFARAYGGDFAGRLGLVRFPDCALDTPRAGCAQETVSGVNNDLGTQELTATLIASVDSCSAPAVTPSDTPSDTPSPSPTEEVTPSDTASPTVSPSPSQSSAPSPSPSATPSPTATPSPSPDSLAEVCAAAHTVGDSTDVDAGRSMYGSAPPYALSSSNTGQSGDYGATPLQGSDSWSVGESSGGLSYAYPFTLPPAVAGAAPSLGLSYSSQSVDGRTSASNAQPSQVGEGWTLDQGFVERSFGSCADDGHAAWGDLCWSGNMEYTLSVAGHAGRLVKSGANEWRLGDDPSWRVQTFDDGDNGDDVGSYFKVYTPDGTKYWFGLGFEPRNDPRIYTNSAFNVPVFGDDAGEPCYASSAAASWCMQTWRWNLDRIEDRNGNVTTITYKKETNYYARQATPANVSRYDRGGYPIRISYGQRSGSESAQQPAQVEITAAHRCAAQASCPEPTPANGAEYPDVPLDLMCTSSTYCSGGAHYAPSFFSTEEIKSLTTRVFYAGALHAVDRYDLVYKFPDAGDHKLALWLDSAQRTGLGLGGNIALPPVLFDGVAKRNRVDYNVTAGVPEVYKWRLDRITDELGAKTTVTYGQPDACDRNALPNWSTNTTDCFPQWFKPDGSPPGWGIFNKYLVTSVLVEDTTGLSPSRTTSYEYLDTPAWHHDTSLLATHKSWSDYRGYGKVRVSIAGDGNSKATQHVIFTLRGMHGDPRSDGTTKSVTLTDSAGLDVVDKPYLAGRVYEQQQLTDGVPFLKTLHRYWWSGTTAAGADTDHNASMVREAETISSELNIYSSTWRDRRVAYTYSDSKTTGGILTSTLDEGDVAIDGDGKCTRRGLLTSAVTSADPGSNTWLLDYPRAEDVAAGPCSDTTVIGRTEYDYDGQAYNAVPNRGNVTRVRSFYGSGQMITTAAAYDSYGRVVSSTRPNAVGVSGAAATTTAYNSPAPGYPTNPGYPTDGVVVTNPLGQVTKVVPHPEWGAPKAATDPNGGTTSITMDALGRTTSVTRPGDSAASTKYLYAVERGGQSRVRTIQSLDGSRTVSSWVYLNGFGDPAQTQAPSPLGSGRTITSTRYDAQGRVARQSAPYFNADSAGAGLFVPDPSAELPHEHRYVYDAAGRTTLDKQVDNGLGTASTTYEHHGIYDRELPPLAVGLNGATDTYHDVFGRTTKVVEFGIGATTDYTYTRSSDLATIKDSAPDPAQPDVRNTTSYTYDWLHRRTRGDDPDTGTWTYQYDDDGNLVTVSDARVGSASRSTFTTFDALDRPTQTFAGTSTAGALLLTRGYDTSTRGKGKPAFTRTRAGGADYTVTYGTYDLRGRLSSKTWTIPDADLRTPTGTYTITYGYDLADHLTELNMPPIGTLPAEKVTTAYNAQGFPESMLGAGTGLANTNYLRDVDYNGDATLTSRDIGDGAARLTRQYYWQQPGGRLSRTTSTAAGASLPNIEDIRLVYDDNGNVTTVTDGKSFQRECFGYDYRNRLTRAYTNDTGCDDPASTASADPYDLAYTYNDLGGITRVTDGVHAARSMNHTYTDTSHVHFATRVKRTDGTTTGERIFTSDANGSVLTRTHVVSDTVSNTQTLTWDALHHLTKTAETSNGSTIDTTYVYDADGNRLIKRTGAIGSTDTDATLYLDGTELRSTTANGVRSTSSARYYGNIAVRTAASATPGNSVTLLLRNRQNSASISVSEAGVATVVRYDPYGAQRGAWTPRKLGTERGFLDKTEDAGDLVRVGARYYDPTAGRFLSVDPLAVPGSPQTLNGYAYALGNPTTFSDPSGLIIAPPPTGNTDQGHPELTPTPTPGFTTGGNPTRRGAVPHPSAQAAPDPSLATGDGGCGWFDWLCTAAVETGKAAINFVGSAAAGAANTTVQVATLGFARTHFSLCAFGDAHWACTAGGYAGSGAAIGGLAYGAFKLGGVALNWLGARLGMSGAMTRVITGTAPTAQRSLSELQAAADATLPQEFSRADWGRLVWGGGPNAADAARGLIGRTAEELAKIPGLTVESATAWRNFYEGAASAAQGADTAQARVDLLDDVIRTLGGSS